MDSLGSGNIDVSKMSDAEKQDLQQFVVNETQKARIQQFEDVGRSKALAKADEELARAYVEWRQRAGEASEEGAGERMVARDLELASVKVLFQRETDDGAKKMHSVRWWKNDA
ncbi:hypothetical protein D6C83_05852 [Aureobasidium pullulans]|uniref:Uncharacterized protein n=1 Tax=Aureobasidium pullulans TaxID=5580 RepID=A0A4T0CBJ3_AURPU|nr:hypothetical protein D6C83_05852 [Aureobasidium pullulans]